MTLSDYLISAALLPAFCNKQAIMVIAVTSAEAVERRKRKVNNIVERVPPRNALLVRIYS